MILATKMFVPRVRRETVLRPRLLDRLDAGLAGKLVLISAPAGFGKTTLVTDWLANSQHFCAPTRVANGRGTNGHAGALHSDAMQGGFIFTWLSLDEGDNDPVRFFGYLVAALQKVDPEVGLTAQSMLVAPQPPTLDALMMVLVNELAESASAVALVLDDYHVITQAAIHQAVAFLVDQLPPQVRVIMISRADPPLPLARLRVRREVTEVRVQDLRFTQGEAATFLNHALGRTLRTSDVAALEERTEGWVAGLQLAALSMSEREDLEPFIRSFTGSNAFVVDYLTEEVIHRQPLEVQEFLFATAVLNRFCGSLCDAVREAPDGDSQAYLERLEKAHLFLTPLDDERGWYRYHHLFAELLRSRLLQSRPALIPQLHRRASAWFMENGWPLDGVAHALSGQDFRRAAEIIESSAIPLLNRGETITLLQWLDRLPGEEVRKRPRLSLARAVAAMRAHRLPEAETHLQDAEEAARQAALETGMASPEVSIAGEILAVRSNIALNSNRLLDAIALGEEALAVLPAEQKRMRGEVMMHLGLAFLWSTRFDQAADSFVEAARQSEAAGDLYTALLSHANHGTLFFMTGHLRRAAAKFRHVLDLAAQHGASQIPATAMTYQPLAELYYEWNDLSAAGDFAVQAVERSLRSGNPRILVLCYAIQARIQMAEGKTEESRATIAQARRLVEERTLPKRYADEVNSLEVKFWLKHGEMERAAEWVTNSALRPNDFDVSGKEGQYRLLARVLLAQGELESALELVRRLYASAQRSGKMLSLIETLALTSVVEMSMERERAALATLQEALLLAEPEGHVRTFLDEGAQMGRLLRLMERDLHRDALETAGLKAYVDRLLAAWEVCEGAAQENIADVPPVTGKAEVVSELIEPLSERELEVLQLVWQGLSDRQIADRLVIVPGTVKRHLNSIYGKLGVHSRTQALTRARQLSLIENVR